MRSPVFVLLALCSVMGCSRGCLTVESTRERPPDLGGTDCSDGLARCVDGRIEVSRLAHLPHPCSRPNETKACECPWDTTRRCPAGCALEEAVVTANFEAANAHLCRPDALVARPVFANDPPSMGVCANTGIDCIDGVVRACDAIGRPVRTLAICLYGCDEAVGFVDGEEALLATASLDGLTAIVCRRSTR